MVITPRLKNQHLLWRAAFGPMAENAASLDTMPHRKLWAQLLDTSSISPQKIDVASNLYDGMIKGAQDFDGMKDLTKEQKQAIRHQSEEDLKNLNLKWLSEMINSEQ